MVRIRSSIKAEEYVAVAESCIQKLGSKIHSLGHGSERYHAVTPMERNAGVYDDGENEVKHYAGYHHQQALPCRFETKLPGFRQIVGIDVGGGFCFVDHSGYVAVAAERKPPESVYGVAPCRTLTCIRLVLATYAETLQAVFRTVFFVVAQHFKRAGHRVVFQQREPGIEKKVETVDLHAEQAREEVMSEFVDRDEYYECQHKLCGFDCYIHFY